MVPLLPGQAGSAVTHDSTQLTGQPLHWDLHQPRDMAGHHEVPAPALASHAPAPAPAASPARVSQDNVVTMFIHNPLLKLWCRHLGSAQHTLTHTNNGACSFLSRQSPQPRPRLGGPPAHGPGASWPPPPAPVRCAGVTVWC